MRLRPCTTARRGMHSKSNLKRQNVTAAASIYGTYMRGDTFFKSINTTGSLAIHTQGLWPNCRQPTRIH